MAQIDNYKTYFKNGCEIFSSLDNSYQSFLKELHVRKLTEWKCTTDSTGYMKDSIICNVLIFDTVGRVVERYFDFRFNSTKHKVVHYTYQNEILVDSTFSDPYIFPEILSGTWIFPKPIQYCEYRNESYQIENITWQDNSERDIERLQFYYSSDLFVKRYYYPEFLISKVEYFKGDRLVHRHRVIYELRH